MSDRDDEYSAEFMLQHRIVSGLETLPANVECKGEVSRATWEEHLAYAA